MAIVVTNIGTIQQAAGASAAVTVPASGVPAGALVIVIAGEDSLTPGGSVADTAGNTYSVGASKANVSGFGRIFYAWNVAALVSGNSITYTKQTSGDKVAVSACYATGIQTTSDPIDGAFTATASGSSTSPSVTSGTAAVSGELVVGASVALGRDIDTFTQDAAYSTPPTAINNAGAGSVNPLVAGGNLVNAGTGAKTYAPTITSRPWSALIVAFAATASDTLFAQACL